MFWSKFLITFITCLPRCPFAMLISDFPLPPAIVQLFLKLFDGFERHFSPRVPSLHTFYGFYLMK